MALGEVNLSLIFEKGKLYLIDFQIPFYLTIVIVIVYFFLVSISKLINEANKPID